MALDKLNVPKTITVGFNERPDTYTKKLAYVIYTDAKGVLRKEASWQSWRDKKIAPETYDNEPMTGFVLNKKVGGNNYSWNPRNTYVRVFDPRGFEFEISVPNLLFILQESSSIKGKGLEGEFVYAWDGTELVLLPTTCQEYKTSTNFTGLQSKKVSKTEIKEGFIYRNKDNDRVMYLGRFDWSEENHNYSYEESNAPSNGYNRYGSYYNRNTIIKYNVKTSKKHIFVYLDKQGYWLQTGFTKIAEIESADVSTLFADKYDELKTTCPNIGSEFIFEKETYNIIELTKDKEYFNIHCIVGNDRLDISGGYSYYKDGECNFSKYENKYSISLTKDGLTLINKQNYKSTAFKVTIDVLEHIVADRYNIVNVNNNTVLHKIEC